MIKLQNITQTYTTPEGKSFDALKNVSLEIRPGEIFGIIGRSGAGKSTLVRCINLLNRPTSGNVVVDGKILTDLSEAELREARRSIGMIFQHFNLLSSRTVYRNVALPLELAGVPEEKIREKITPLIELVGLSEHANKYPSQLSGGQKQRVALARTLVMKPKLLLLDEPLSALDGLIKESIKDRIKQVARQLKLTTLIVTHDPEEALTLSDRVLIIENGHIAQFDTPERIIRTPANEFVERFILSQLTIKRDNIFRLFASSLSGLTPPNAAAPRAAAA